MGSVLRAIKKNIKVMLYEGYLYGRNKSSTLLLGVIRMFLYAVITALALELLREVSQLQEPLNLVYISSVLFVIYSVIFVAKQFLRGVRESRKNIEKNQLILYTAEDYHISTYLTGISVVAGKLGYETRVLLHMDSIQVKFPEKMSLMDRENDIVAHYAGFYALWMVGGVPYDMALNNAKADLMRADEELLQCMAELPRAGAPKMEFLFEFREKKRKLQRKACNLVLENREQILAEAEKNRRDMLEGGKFNDCEEEL